MMTEEDGTEDWLNAFGRGGLRHVSDQIFYAVEEVVLLEQMHTSSQIQASTY